MIRAILLMAFLLVSPADAQLFGRRSYSPPATHYSPPYSGSITGNVTDLPQEPEYYTVLVLPQGYTRNQDALSVFNAFGSDPTLIALRRATCTRAYVVNDPDFWHRFNPAEQFPGVLRGRSAMLVVDRGGGLVWWYQADTPEQYAADIRANGVLTKLSESTGGIFSRIRRPKVCTPETCPPTTPGTPTQPLPDDEPLRPTLPPIDEEPVPDSPLVPPTPTGPTPPVSVDVEQLQSQINELKQQLTVNVNIANAAKAAAEKPFYIRVVDPRGRYTSEVKTVRLGQQVDLTLEPFKQ